VSLPTRDNPASAPGEFVRDPLANPAAIAAARERSMAERLELAISWNKVASELRAGMVRVTEEAAAQDPSDAGRAAPEHSAMRQQRQSHIP
jgi:hypothetical protein